MVGLFLVLTKNDFESMRSLIDKKKWIDENRIYREKGGVF
jgi:hypothetical protein